MVKMVIEIPDFGATAVARLYEDFAPQSIRALQTVLPFTGPGIHAMRAGREVFTLIPKPSLDPGAENQSVFPAPGDLYLFHQPAGYRPMDVPLRFRAEKGTTEYWHIAIWYGRDFAANDPDRSISCEPLRRGRKRIGAARRGLRAHSLRGRPERHLQPYYLA